jgi:uracil-DNA glycosylase
MPSGSALADLAAEIRACRRCIEAPMGAPLPHTPRPVLRVAASARIVVAGQAPGTRVHHSGVPFTDPSGDRLRDWMGVSLAEFYDADRIAIVPMGFCFPGLDANGGDLPPRRECAPLWRARVLAALPEVRLILAVGQYAHRWHIAGARRSVTETVRAGGVDAREPSAAKVIALPHPSWRNNGWVRANPWFERKVLPGLRHEVRRLLEPPK